MAFFPRPVTMMMLVRPEATASSITYWMIGLSTSGSISLGCALVAGRNRVPRPAAGKTALRRGFDTGRDATTGLILGDPETAMLDLKFVVEDRSRIEEMLKRRGQSLPAGTDDVWTLDGERRQALQRVEDLRHRQKKVGEEIARLGREKQDTTALKAEMKGV